MAGEETQRKIDDYIDPTSRLRALALQAGRNVRSLRIAALAPVVSPFGADDASVRRLEKAAGRISGPGWSPPIVVIRDARYAGQAYLIEELNARRAKRRICSGDCDTPEDWRRAQRESCR